MAIINQGREITTRMRSLKTSKRLAAAAVLTALLANPGFAPGQSTGAFAGISARMQQFVGRGELAGVVTLVASKDKVLHLAATGMSDLQTQRPMRTDDLFWIASMTKPVVAVCIAMLADDRKLQLDDPLAKHLAEFANLTVTESGQSSKPSRPVTLWDVLTHTSGIGEVRTREPHLTLEQTSKLVAQQPLRFQPGTRWGYSTAAIDVLGRVVEVVSGTPFETFLQTRLLDPLGMKNTSFWVSPKDEQRLARSYRWNPESSKLEETTIPYLYKTAPTDRKRPPLAGAGLFSTAEDVARFYQMMLNRGTLNGRRILHAETVDAMTINQTGKLAARPGMPWGLGFAVIDDPAQVPANSVLSRHSFGHGGAFSTQSWADPAKNLIWVVMFQRDNKGNPDNSDVRIAFQEEAVKALGLSAIPAKAASERALGLAANR